MDSLITTLIGSSLGAVIGAWAGSKAAYTRLRSQRAFERRLDWYDGVLAALGEFRSSLAAATTHDRLEGFDAEGKRLWLATAQRYAPVADRLEQAEAYAPNQSVLRLRHLHEDYRQYNKDLSRSLGETPEALASRLTLSTKLSVAAREASIALALDVRKHLGLDDLDLALLREGAELPPLPRLGSVA